MNQRADQFGRNIPATGAAIEQKPGALEAKPQQFFDLKHQAAERPWMVFGAAVAAGYVLGSMGGGEEEQRWHGTPATTTDYNQHAYASHQQRDTSSQARSSSGSGVLSQFDDEINMLKTAAVGALTVFLRDKIKEYLPALGQQLASQVTGQSQQNMGQSGKARSTAQGTSRSYNATGSQSVNTEAIPTTTSYGSNLVDRGSEHAKPYYPPGSAGTTGDRERSVGDDTSTY